MIQDMVHASNIRRKVFLHFVNYIPVLTVGFDYHCYRSRPLANNSNGKSNAIYWTCMACTQFLK